MPRKRSRRLAPKVKAYFKALEDGKAGYETASEILGEFLGKKKLKPGESIPMGDGKVARLKDNFLNKDGEPVNKIYRAHGIARYELEIVSA